MVISEKDWIVPDDRLSEIFNEHFINITNEASFPLLQVFPKLLKNLFKDHPSINKNFFLRRKDCQFKFHSVNEHEVRKVILNMNEKKRT